MRIYLAGPMRGIPLFNFPAFDRYKAHLQSLGHEVVSPADLDREAGFDEHREHSEEELAEMLPTFLQRDFETLCQCDAIALMPGWRKSAGTGWELHGARLLGLSVLDAETGEPLKETICQEADRLVSEDRNDIYGHPYDDFGRTAGMLTAYFGFEVTRHDIAAIHMLTKLSRLKQTPRHRDSKTDIAGYSKCWDMVCQREMELENAGTS